MGGDSASLAKLLSRHRLDSVLFACLHEVIKVRDLCRSAPQSWQELREKLWHIYQGSNKREFSQRLRRFLEWAKGQDLRDSIQRRIQRWKGKSHLFQRAYDHEGAYRTNNAVDRPMNYLDRTLFSMQYFHGSWEAAVKLDAPWRCYGIFTLSVAKLSRGLDSSVPLNSSMAFDITMIGYATSSSLLHSMAGDHFSNRLTQNSLEPGSNKRLRQAEDFLWRGAVDEASQLFEDCNSEEARKFRGYLKRHRERIPNYGYYQAEGIPIGSGDVESLLKRISNRVKISGASWETSHVP